MAIRLLANSLNLVDAAVLVRMYEGMCWNSSLRLHVPCGPSACSRGGIVVLFNFTKEMSSKTRGY